MTNRLTTKHVHNSIDTLLERIRDMNSKIVGILQSNTNTRRVTESNKALYTGLEERVRQIDKMEEEVNSVANQTEYLNQAALVCLDEAEDDFVVSFFSIKTCGTYYHIEHLFKIKLFYLMFN